MYTMVLMMAVGGSADTASFGGRRASCHGGGYVAVASCYGSGHGSCYGGGHLPAYTGGCWSASYGSCSGYVAGGCNGVRRVGILGGLFGHRNHSCHGGGCSGYVAATPAGCCGHVHVAATCCAPVASCCAPTPCCGAAVASPVITGGVPCITAGMTPLGVQPLVTPSTPMPEGAKPNTTTPDKMPKAEGATPGVTPGAAAPAGGAAAPNKNKL